MNSINKKSIKEKVLEKIKEGRIKMRSKTHFILKTVLTLLAVFILALFVLYLISFITFVLRASGIWFLPGFGFHGIRIFFTSLPWLLILAALFLIIVLEIFVKRFSFSYRRPILYSVLIIILVVLLGGFIINRTQFHSGLFQRAQEGRLPVAGEFYRGFGMPEFRNMQLGIVSEITDNGFLIETRERQTLTIVIDSETRFPFGTGIKEGDRVIVLGERDNGTIQASDVRKINNNFDIFPRSPRFKPRNILEPHSIPLMPDR